MSEKEENMSEFEKRSAALDFAVRLAAAWPNTIIQANKSQTPSPGHALVSNAKTIYSYLFQTEEGKP